MLQAQQVLQNRYQLVRQLGNNAGRQTWLAKDLVPQPPRPVVVKLLAFVDPITWKTIDLFEREAKILQQLSHPLIPRYLDCFSLNDRILWFGLVQEFIPGNSLKDLLEKGTRFSEKSIGQIAAEVLQILIYLHRLDPPVFHRDIKPSNLIWGRDRHIHLIDFGAVQDKAAEAGATFTVVGTYGYAPMEQFGGRTVPSSDLYALGATLIHLLTGVAPADLPQEGLRIQFADRIDVRPGLVRWIEKLMEPDPVRRFSTAEQALASLQGAIQNQNLPASPAASNGLGADTSASEAVPSQRPENNRIEIHRSPEALEIRILGSSFWKRISHIAGFISVASFASFFLPHIILFAVNIVTFYLAEKILYWEPPLVLVAPLIPIGTLCGLLSNLGYGNAISSVVKLTRNRFTYYQEGWFCKLFDIQWIVFEVPTPEIQRVFHHKIGRRKRLITIRTASQDLSLTRTKHKHNDLFIYENSACKLTYSECEWLVQEIERWLGL